MRVTTVFSLFLHLAFFFMLFNFVYGKASQTKFNKSDLNDQKLLFSVKQFNNSLETNGYKAANLSKYNAFIKNLPKGLIVTKLEASMFLAQILAESGGLKYKEELACIKTGCPGRYDESVGYPNKTYYGRGYIQLTHSYNYKAASMDLYGDDRLVRRPELVAIDEDAAWATAMWYWKVRVHYKKGVSEGYFGVTTMAINGKICAYPRFLRSGKHRFEMYKRIVEVLDLNVESNERGCYN